MTPRRACPGPLGAIAPFALACAADTPPPATPLAPPPAAAAPAAAPTAGVVADIPVVSIRAHAPVVTFRALYHSGSAGDPPGKQGLTALTARLLVEGGTVSMTAAELKERLYPMAAELSAYTEKDLTVIHGRCHVDHLDRFTPIFVEVLAAPRLDEREFARLRQDALNDVEKRLGSEDDEALGKAALQSLLYRGHPYAHPPAGTLRGLRALTAADARDRFLRAFGRARLRLGVAEPEPGRIADLVAGLLRDLHPGAPPAPLPPAPPDPRTRVLIVKKDTRAVAISLGHAYALSRAHADFVPVAAATSALGEHRQFGGRLFRALRALRGLNYGDYAYPDNFVQEGWSRFGRTNVGRRQNHFEVWLRPVEPQNALFALRGALYHVDRWAREGVSEEEVGRTREFLTGYLGLFDETDARRLGYALDDAVHGTREFLASFAGRLPSLGAATVNAAVRRHVDPARLRIAIVARDAEALRDALVRGDRPTIQYPAPKGPEVLAEDDRIASFPLRLSAGEIEIVTPAELLE